MPARLKKGARTDRQLGPLIGRTIVKSYGEVREAGSENLIPWVDSTMNKSMCGLAILVLTLSPLVAAQNQDSTTAQQKSSPITKGIDYRFNYLNMAGPMKAVDFRPLTQQERTPSSRPLLCCDRRGWTPLETESSADCSFFTAGFPRIRRVIVETRRFRKFAPSVRPLSHYPQDPAEGLPDSSDPIGQHGLQGQVLAITAEAWIMLV
jgi:hypothetical protein